MNACGNRVKPPAPLNAHCMSNVRGEFGKPGTGGVDGTVRSQDVACDQKVKLQTPDLDDLRCALGWLKFRLDPPLAVEATANLNLAPVRETER